MSTVENASQHDEQYRVIVDRRDLFDYLRAAWRDGQSYGESSEPVSWQAASAHAEECIKGWTTMENASRIAELEKAASQPAPECEELLEWMEEAVEYVNVPTRSPSLEAEGRKLLRLAKKSVA